MASASGDLDAQNKNFDAEQLKEAIAEEEVNQPKVNTDSDYERSKKYSVPDKARDESEISSSIGSSFKSDNTTDNSTEGNPDNFSSMAKDINSNKA